MKTNTIIFLILFSFASTRAQEVTEKHIDFTGKGSVELNIQIADSINLHTWNKNEVFVTASVNINDNEDNEGYIITFGETGNSVIINAKFKDDYFKGRNNCCTVTDIFWEVYIPERTAFNLETINANITIGGITDEIHAKSISGFIDLAAPSDRRANIRFSTISGTIYTNHELVGENRYSGIPSVIRQNLNDGGSPVTLETISGDIFFRKTD
jgi:hypothetical protein